jgi:hypothetical protein
MTETQTTKNSKTDETSTAQGVEVKPQVSPHLNSFDYFQMSDRCYCIDKMIKELIECHPVYFGDKKIRDLINSASENLRIVHQLADGIGFTLKENED